MSKLYIHETARVGSLADKQVLDLTAELSNMTIENDLRRKLQDNIRRLRDMGAYRGRRHARHMPVRGQRTRTQVCKPIHHGLPAADMRQDCHRWEVEQSREIWLVLGCIILQHFTLERAHHIGVWDDFANFKRQFAEQQHIAHSTFTDHTRLF